MSKILLAVVAMTLCGVAQAKDGKFAKEHPRRAEVVKREKGDKAKFEKAEDNGKITEKQEKKLDKEENAIRRQERAEAKANGGHITKGEQRQLNKEEHAVEKQERRMKKRDAAKKDAPAPAPAQ
jgi:hypothetical protein